MDTSASSSSKFTQVSFNHSVSVKLSKNNFLLWRQQVQAAINGYKLQSFMKPRLAALEAYFAAQTRPKLDQYKTQLQNTKKGDLSINKYLLKINGCVDSLVSIGHSLSTKDHLDAIFNGLPKEYDIFIISTNSRHDKHTVEEIDSLLLAQESRIERYAKELDSASPSTNMAIQS